MSVRATEISDIIREQLSGFQDSATITNVGRVISVGDGIANVYGLSKVMASELVEFPKTGTLGLAFNLEEEAVGVIVLGLGWLPNIEDRTRQGVAQIKANSAFTQQMGEDMNIFGTTVPPGQVLVSSAQALSGSQVAITAYKAGFALVTLRSRRGGGSWETLAVMDTPNFLDNRPPLVPGQPEQREYTVQGYENQQNQGAVSPIVTAVTLP